tara:strand:+ start:521 stop:1339 length:819 start_codon:yes stop_codon:yes gene_type:complete
LNLKNIYNMLKIKLLIFSLCLFTLSISAQKSVNDFKYIIVPSQFEFQNNAGDFQLNEMTKFLFNKYGFIALLSTEVFPKDLGENNCLALTAHLRKKSSLFTIKMKYDLVNCYNEIIFTSIESPSKNKDYERAYHESIKKTFKSIEILNYKYSEKENTVFEETLEMVENKIVFKEEKSSKIIEEVEKIVEIVIEPEFVAKEISNDLLYAQETNDGYKLIDTAPKLMYILQATSLKDVYTLKNKNGILFKQNEKWFVEYYLNKKLIKKELTIKF